MPRGSQGATGLSKDTFVLPVSIFQPVLGYHTQRAGHETVFYSVQTSCCQNVITLKRTILMGDQLITTGHTTTSYSE